VLLPNANAAIRFAFELDLKKAYREFKGKHGMVGFDTQGRMLYLGKCMNEDVFLGMAPRSFVSGGGERCEAGASSGSSRMSKRHARMATLMMLHFLTKVRNRWFSVQGDVYEYDVDSWEIPWGRVSSVM
jgi:hypothetical protein